MATLEQNKIALENLVKKANQVTGKNDGDITGAINSLIAGYGKGGSGTIPAGYYYLKSDVEEVEAKENPLYLDVVDIGCRVIKVTIPTFDGGLEIT